MTERLTKNEMCDRFRSEWLVIVEPEHDTQRRVVAGRVLAHGTDKAKVYASANESAFSHIAFMFTGPLRRDVAFIL